MAVFRHFVCSDGDVACFVMDMDSADRGRLEKAEPDKVRQADVGLVKGDKY